MKVCRPISRQKGKRPIKRQVRTTRGFYLTAVDFNKCIQGGSNESHIYCVRIITSDFRGGHICPGGNELKFIQEQYLQAHIPDGCRESGSGGGDTRRPRCSNSAEPGTDKPRGCGEPGSDETGARDSDQKDDYSTCRCNTATNDNHHTF